MVEKNVFWNEAGKAGLVLGGISAAYLLTGWLFSLIPAEAKMLALTSKFLDVILWGVKFAACLMLMKSFMKRYAASDPDCTGQDTFRFGAASALLSALVYSAAYLAYVKFLNPDIFNHAVETLKNSPMMDSNTRETMEAVLPELPAISFFVNLFYCTIFGTVVAAIFSRNIPSRNPFVNDSNKR